MTISKTTIIIAILSVITLFTGGFAYYNTKLLNKEITTLKDSNKELSDKISQQNTIIENIKSDVIKNRKEITDLDTKRKDIDKQMSSVITKLSKHDIVDLTKKKPKLIENILNKSDDKYREELRSLKWTILLKL